MCTILLEMFEVNFDEINGNHKKFESLYICIIKECKEYSFFFLRSEKLIQSSS